MVVGAACHYRASTKRGGAHDRIHTSNLHNPRGLLVLVCAVWLLVLLLLRIRHKADTISVKCRRRRRNIERCGNPAATEGVCRAIALIATLWIAYALIFWPCARLPLMKQGVVAHSGREEGPNVHITNNTRRPVARRDRAGGHSVAVKDATRKADEMQQLGRPRPTPLEAAAAVEATSKWQAAPELATNGTALPTARKTVTALQQTRLKEMKARLQHALDTDRFDQVAQIVADISAMQQMYSGLTAENSSTPVTQKSNAPHQIRRSCPERCYKCKPGSPSDGGTQLYLDAGQPHCVHFCSPNLFCGLGKFYQTENSAVCTDCPRTNCPERCYKCKPGSPSDGGTQLYLDAGQPHCVHVCSAKLFCGLGKFYQTENSAVCTGCPGSRVQTNSLSQPSLRPETPPVNANNTLELEGVFAKYGAQINASVNSSCAVQYAIPTTGYRTSFAELVAQLYVVAGVAGERIHLFVDDTATKANNWLLAQLRKYYGVHVHRCGNSARAQQLRLHPMRAWPINTAKKKTSKLYYHYALMFRTMFEQLEVPYLAVLEDDLAIAPDIDGYLCRHAPLMAHDPDIVQVTTHNDAGFWPTAADPRRVFRHEHFAQPGWMTSKEVWHRHISPRWIGPVRTHWDLAMQYLVFGQGNPLPVSIMNAKVKNVSGVRMLPTYKAAPPAGQLNTIAPEVPRTFHRRSQGALTMDKLGSQLLDFDNMRLNSEAIDWAAVPVQHLTSRASFSQLVRKHIELAAGSGFVDCIGALSSRAGQRTSLVVMLNCTSDSDRRCWDSAMMDNFNLFGVGLGGIPRNVFQGTVFLRWQTNLVLFVGGKYSPFAQQAEIKQWQRKHHRYTARNSTKPDAPVSVCNRSRISAVPPGTRVVLAGAGQSCEQACSTCCDDEPGATPRSNNSRSVELSPRGQAQPQSITPWRCDVELLSLLNPQPSWVQDKRSGTISASSESRPESLT
jgi:hypothetical protein